MAQPTILLTRQEMAQAVDVAAAVGDIERAMAAFEKGLDYLPPKAIFTNIPVTPGSGPSSGALAACITGHTLAAGLLTMKVGQERTDNVKRDLPTTNSWVLVFEPDTGELLMICDGTLPTMLRTAAAAAVGVKQLARQDAKTLTVIGAGQLGKQCLRIAGNVRPFERILLYDKFEQAANTAANDLADQVGAAIEVADAEQACRQADVIVTATNSHEPIIGADWIGPGTHLSCMGSDMPDKIECEMSLLPRCCIFADKIEHALQRGEASQAVASGVLDDNCYAGSLGQVINGDVPGRTDDQQITMYDGVGIGIQDTTIARTIYDQAVAKKLGTPLAFS